jgi:hypothetical protein
MLAAPFDIPGVELGHRDGLCSFDAIIERYGLTDKALLRLARIINAADTGHLESDPLAAGLEALAVGVRTAFPGRSRESGAAIRPLRRALLLSRRIPLALQFGVLRAIEMATAVLVYIPVAYWAARGQKKPFVIRGLKEFGEPTRKARIMDLAPEGRKASMFGLYYLIRDVIVSVAAFGAAYLWSLGPRVNLLTAFACGVAGAVWFALRGRNLGAPDPARS